MGRSRSDAGLEITSEYLPEPLLRFGDGRDHVDPKLGISRFGPKSYGPTHRHPQSVRVGIIGSAESVESARE